MIEHYRFGAITVDARTYRKDLKIIRGEVVPDWWRKEGHEVDVDDLRDVFTAKPEILVIGTGDSGRMETSPSLRSALADANIRLIEAPTAEASRTFNRLLKEGKDVAGAFHLTC